VTPATTNPRASRERSSTDPGLAALVFLVGRWQGEGFLRGAPVTSRTWGAPFGAGMIRVDAETFRDGALVHRERIVLREKDGRVEASTSPWRGDAQRFAVAEEPGPRFVLTSGAFVWTITPEGADAWSESFGVVTAPAQFEEIVALRHVRVPA
jgi:hypothetical protein